MRQKLYLVYSVTKWRVSICCSEATLALQQLIALRGPDENVSATQPGIHGYKALHKCPVCTRSFRGSTYLRLHLRTHTGM